MTAPPAAQHSLTPPAFTQRFSSTPLGARLARHLTLNQLHAWGIPYGSEASEKAAVVVAELSANAVTHGRVPGRDFELRLSLPTGSLRIEVTDTRAERVPPGPGAVPTPGLLDDSGRGLTLVDALADRWEVQDRDPPGKTVLVEIDLPGWLSLIRRLPDRRPLKRRS
ncbi:ATP-binding protein [Streptomyces ipomoeae]|jgi:anti-sigma regulatory factor (Ser/Thr protein kinase)|uniref:ATPase/histidine kinase/DNA gyrase B/HSP90 domain protein n=2 Tax=Streptomyces ipomoeae TaxID=103232 RepID=L1KSZ8_9ACTN|nr:ATP-binding protein [Streptomyces ipomoeae]EKX63508.1 ATPase/histidine kinase/DNA gyrase B/HSP90 domain protein [Streptomyces ipomoeae 91-03]MDX2697786.1 ATP-binding protein [Streptomyces ipomoeae]MDX2825260.1 ATP-binding protein [Streptomyces ipomoeae]MDX2846767.1 ATP-binding protein [Streptomyces ipomoeae]MDX2877815.1 ATP-binding protein [Streptomyces ipomoeae]